MPETKTPQVLDEQDQRELLRIARLSVREWLREGKLPPGSTHRPALLEPHGAHVRLRGPGLKRSCENRIVDQPLYLTVAGLAINAATAIPAIDLAEVATMRIEIELDGPNGPYVIAEDGTAI